MSNFKRVLEIEKKFDHNINNINLNFEKNLEKFISDSKLSEDVIKADFRSNLNKDFKKSIENYNREAEKILRDAKDEVDYIKKNSNISKVVDFILGEIKNV